MTEFLGYSGGNSFCIRIEYSIPFDKQFSSFAVNSSSFDSLIQLLGLSSQTKSIKESTIMTWLCNKAV